MSDNLGDFASLLGEGFSQAAQSDERDRRKAEKRAMRDQLLYAFAAPLVSAAGKGVVDFGADVLLGSNSKDFFSTKEGTTLMRRFSDINKASEDIDSTMTALTKAGDGDGREGVYRNNLLRATQDAQRKYGGAADRDILIENAIANLEPEIRQASEDEYNELLSIQKALRLNPSDEEVLRRYRETAIGKGRGRKVFGKLASFFTGKNYQKEVVEPAASYLIHGGDLEIQQSDFYKLFTDGNFNDQLSDLLREAQNLRGRYNIDEDDLVNAVELFEHRNSDLMESLSEEKRLDRQDAKEAIQVRSVIRSNPTLAAAAQDYERLTGNKPNQSQLTNQVLGSVKGMATDQVEGFVNRFRTDHKPAYDKVAESFASQMYANKAEKQDDGTFRTFEKLDSSERALVQDATDSFISGLAGRFGTDLRTVVTEIQEEAAGDFSKIQGFTAIQEGGVQILAGQYVEQYINGLPMKSVDPGQYEGGAIVNMYNRNFLGKSPKTLENVTTTEMRKGLSATIRNALIDRDLGAGLQVDAVDRGIQSKVSRPTTNQIYMIDPSILNEATSDIKELLSDDTLSEEEQQDQAIAELEALKNIIGNAATSRGFNKIDPSFPAKIRELELMIMGQEPQSSIPPRMRGRD